MVSRSAKTIFELVPKLTLNSIGTKIKTSFSARSVILSST